MGNAMEMTATLREPTWWDKIGCALGFHAWFETEVQTERVETQHGPGFILQGRTFMWRDRECGKCKRYERKTLYKDGTSLPWMKVLP